MTAGIKCFNIESPAELDRIANTARNLGLKAHISVRVNPNIDAHVDHHVATGLGDSKFGVKLTDVIALYQKAAELKESKSKGSPATLAVSSNPLRPTCLRSKCFRFS